MKSQSNKHVTRMKPVICVSCESIRLTERERKRGTGCYTCTTGTFPPPLFPLFFSIPSSQLQTSSSRRKEGIGTESERRNNMTCSHRNNGQEGVADRKGDAGPSARLTHTQTDCLTRGDAHRPSVGHTESGDDMQIAERMPSN